MAFLSFLTYHAILVVLIAAILLSIYITRPRQ